jgi:hypothetical protein
MARVLLKTFTKPDSGRMNTSSPTEQNLMDILSEIWDNRFNLYPYDVESLRKYGHKTAYENINLTITKKR